ncbi:MAG TPA: nitroreductase family protein [Candidatus Avisuccinivibrio pullicola]|nr:nitroreductase family protein [Candidatus Avisuccinivibrio pullicola]
MDFEKLMQERYTCKHYDASKKIPAELITRLLQTVRLTPSAVNLQPWYFFVAETDAAKAKIAPGVMEMNAERFEKCSHVIVLCARTDATEEYISKVVDKEDADGRFGRVPGARAGQDAGKKRFAGLHAISPSELIAWNSRNAYLALATLMYAAADLGIDSTPLEGIVPAAVDRCLNLSEKGLTCLCMVCLGYWAADDSNVLSNRPKSRLALEDIVTEL